MAQLAVFIQINEELLGQIDAQLARMARPHAGPLHNGLRKALEITKKRNYDLLPKPGYPGDRKHKAPLRDTLIVETKEYQQANKAVVLGMVGYSWYGGQHGHNVEYGHRVATSTTGKIVPTVYSQVISGSKVITRRPKNGVFASYRHKRFSRPGFVAGRFDLERAVELTKSQHDAAVIAGIKESVSRTLGRDPTREA